jgi:3,4-dihydroxy 2-butanone 4-phosphate synthase/GTP cyclohydrolase II
MARLPDLIEFAQAHQLKIGTIADLIHYRSENECLVERKAERNITTPFGKMRLMAYTDRMAQETHLALVKGTPSPDQEVIVRVHEPLSVFDLLDNSIRSHSWNMLEAMKAISNSECGVIVMLNRNENGEELLNRILNADEPIRIKHDLRNYGIGSQILLDLGVRKMKLLATPRKMPSMAGFGLEVTGYLEST